MEEFADPVPAAETRTAQRTQTKRRKRIIIGSVIAGLVVVGVLAWQNHEASYPLVAIWAYAGILVRYASSASLMNSHAAIAVTLGACIVVFVAMTVMVFSKRMRSKGKSEE